MKFKTLNTCCRDAQSSGWLFSAARQWQRCWATNWISQLQRQACGFKEFWQWKRKSLKPGSQPAPLQRLCMTLVSLSAVVASLKPWFLFVWRSLKYFVEIPKEECKLLSLKHTFLFWRENLLKCMMPSFDLFGAPALIVFHLERQNNADAIFAGRARNEAWLQRASKWNTASRLHLSKQSSLLWVVIIVFFPVNMKLLKSVVLIVMLCMNLQDFKCHIKSSNNNKF